MFKLNLCNEMSLLKYEIVLRSSLYDQEAFQKEKYQMFG